MEEFKSDGYLVFFGVLEIYSREFSPKDDWILTEKLSFFRHKLGISCSKLKKILSKIYKWEVSYDGEYISIFIPKFRELMDETTLKKLRAKEKSFRNRSGTLPKKGRTDADADADADKEEDINTCPEPEKHLDSGLAKIPILKIPLIKRDGEFQVLESDLNQWQETFQGIDALQTLREIRQWNLDNPSKRKTKNGIRKHISSWMGREQDRNGGRMSTPKAITVAQSEIQKKNLLFAAYVQDEEQNGKDDSGKLPGLTDQKDGAEAIS